MEVAQENTGGKSEMGTAVSALLGNTPSVSLESHIGSNGVRAVGSRFERSVSSVRRILTIKEQDEQAKEWIETVHVYPPIEAPLDEGGLPHCRAGAVGRGRRVMRTPRAYAKAKTKRE